MRTIKNRRLPKIIAKLKFRDKLMISLIAMSFLMAVYMGVSFYQISTSIIYDMGTKLSEKNAAFANSLIEQYLNNTFRNSTQILRLDSLREVLKVPAPEPVGADLKLRLQSDIYEIITYSSSEDNVVFSFVNIYCKNGFTYTSSPSVELPYDDYRSCIEYYVQNGYIKEGYNGSTWCDLVKNVNKFGKDDYSLIHLRILYNPATFEEAGVLISAVEETNLRQQYAEYFSDAMVIHQNGQIVSSIDPTLLGKSIKDSPLYQKIAASSDKAGTVSYEKDGRTQIASFFQTEYLNVYFIVPFEYYNSGELAETKLFETSSVIVSLLGLLIAVAVSLWLSAGLYRSVREVKNVVDKVQGGNLNARYASRNQDEIGYLGNSFNAMLDTIHHNYQIQEEQESLKKKLELQLMQAQINPHLLYNSLNSALLAIKKDNTAKAENLLKHLSKFFKISLSRGDDLIPLQSELELITNYIEIQRLARGKNFQLTQDVPDELRGIRIPKLTLQPIVENSILHGFSGYRDDGRLFICAKVLPKSRGAQDKNTDESSSRAGDGPSFENDLVITVEDNGIGILEEDLRALRDSLNAYPPPAEIKSFGLYNVNRRIKNTFGESYGIDIFSAVGEYTRTVITLPYQKPLEEISNV